MEQLNKLYISMACSVPPQVPESVGFRKDTELEMPVTKITSYYDIVSPYSWLAFEVLTRYEGIWKVPIDYTPFLLGGVMRATGNVPPGSNPYKGNYLFKDIRRNVNHFQVPLSAPSKFPANTMKGQRALIAIKERHPRQLVSCTRNLWELFWRDDQDVESDEALLKYLSMTLSPSDAKDMLDLASSNSIKSQLTKNTTTAVETFGAFGAPWLVAHKDDGTEECFFGSDRFEALAYFMGKPWYGPVPPAIPSNKL